MNPVPLFLIIVTLPLLLGGCGENDVNDEVKPQSESLDKKEFEGVNNDELEKRGNILNKIAYHKGSLYTGKSFILWKNGQQRSEQNYKDGKFDGPRKAWYENGQAWSEINYKDGKQDGLLTQWHENGQKRQESNWKDGEQVEGSEKYWNKKGQPVDTFKETSK